MTDTPASRLAILDDNGRVVAASPDFRDLEPVLIPAIKAKLNTWLRRNGGTAAVEIAGEFPKIGARIFSLAAARLDSNKGLISLSVSDVTREKQAHAALETRLREAESLLRENAADLRQNRSELQALAARLMTTQEEERRRVSRELHDEFNQKLAMIEVDAERLCHDLPPDLGIQAKAQALQRLAAGLSNDIRRVAYELHPSILDHLGLAVALRSYCSEFSARHRIPVKLSTRRAPDRPPDTLALCFYRIAQESLRNVARHAHATLATITLRASANAVHLSVADNGTGFDPESGRRKGSIGLLSMKERARLVDGELTIESKQGEGTRVEVWAPLPQRQKSRDC